jgi:hypothetical protein
MSAPLIPAVEIPRGSPFRGSAQVFSPPWLSRYVGSRYVYSQAIQWDTLAEYTRLGMLQRYPSVAQPDALSEIGRDRRILRGIVETDEHYAERLRVFKRTWKLAGNAPTLLGQLWEYMRPNATKIRYVVNGYEGAVADSASQFTDWWTIDDAGLAFERVSPSNWNWDDSFGKNIRFWIIVYRSDIITPYWGVPPYQWGEEGLYWGAAPGSDRSWLIDTLNLVQQWKAGGSHMGPFPLYAGGLIVADPTFVAAPWGPAGPFAPSYAPGFPMPDGTFADQTVRPVGATYIGGL